MKVKNAVVAMAAMPTLLSCALALQAEELKRTTIEMDGPAGDQVVIVSRGMSQREIETYSNWKSKLTARELDLVERHYATHEAISSRPLMTNSVLGVDFLPTRDLPLAVFDSILKASPESPSIAMLEAFNIQILSPQHKIELPMTAKLRSSLSFGGHRVFFDTDMDLREGDAYYVSRANQFVSNVSNAAIDTQMALQTDIGKATIEHHGLTGLTFNADTVTDMQPLGVPVTYSMRYGDIRVATDFQWVGRPKAVPFNDGTDFLQ